MSPQTIKATSFEELLLLPEFKGMVIIEGGEWYEFPSLSYSEQEIEQRLSRLNLSDEEKEEIGRLLRSSA